MKKLLILFALSIIHFTSFAQDVDSLIQVLNKQKLSITEEFDLYEKISLSSMSSDKEKAKQYAEKGLNLADKEMNKEKELIFTGYLARIYDSMQDFNTAISYYEKALKLAKDANNEDQEAFLYVTAGNVYVITGNYDLALEYMLKSLEIREKLGDKQKAGRVLSNIGSVHRMLFNWERSIYYLNQGIDIAKEFNDSYGMMVAYYDLGVVYLSTKDFEKALEYIEKTVELSRELDDSQYKSLSLQLMAGIYIEGFKDFEKAEKYVLENIQLSEKLGMTRIISVSWYQLAQIYFEQKRYNESEKAALKSYEADSVSIISKLNALPMLVSTNIIQNNKEKAIAFFEEYIKATDNHYEERYTETFSNMEVKYETEKKELQIKVLEKEKQFYIGLSIAGAAILLLILGLSIVYHRMNIQKHKLAEQQHEIAEQQIRQLEKEKQLIATQAVLDGETTERSRLARDLHDGLGGLLSVAKLNLKDIKAYKILDDQDAGHYNKALEMLDQSIGELRRVAHHMMPEALMRYGLKVSLEDFCKAIPGAHFLYFGNERRLEDRMEILLYRCAYELINNAVKHSNATTINVQLIIDEKLISLVVQDNGKGFDPDGVKSGTGLENIRTRVSAYNGKMSIHSFPGKGAEITIEIES